MHLQGLYVIVLIHLCHFIIKLELGLPDTKWLYLADMFYWDYNARTIFIVI